MGNKKEVVEVLLQHGAKVNAKGKEDGSTPLYWATIKEITALLIAHGAEVNAKNKDGYAPLHNAAFSDKKEVVQLLLDAGADKNLKNNKGETPLDFVKRIQYQYGTLNSQEEPREIIALLSKYK